MKFDFKIVISGILSVALLFSVLSMIGIFNKNDIIVNTNNGEEIKEEIEVYIVGEINNPGIYKVEKGSILDQLVTKAGGFTTKVDIENINLAFVLDQNMMIKIKEKTVFDYVGKQGFDTYDEDDKNIMVNLKDATIQELCLIPGVGESTAKQILIYRNENGFEEIEDLMNISGIKEKKFESLKDFVYIE